MVSVLAYAPFEGTPSERRGVVPYPGIQLQHVHGTVGARGTQLSYVTSAKVGLETVILKKYFCQPSHVSVICDK